MTLRASIKQTLAYSAFFNFPLTLVELHFWLITPKPITLTELKKNLSTSDLHLNAKLRRDRKLLTNQKLKANKTALDFLRSIPTINLIALTGSLAMDNAKPADDIDLMLITKRNTLWLTRLFLIPVFRLFFRSRVPLHLHQPNSICLNLWLDEDALIIPKSKQNLYIAHEVLQIRPLSNQNQTYERFILANSWTSEYLANAYKIITSKFTPPAKGEEHEVQRGFILPLLNHLAFRLQHLYMKSKITREYITLHSAYFHPRDLSATLKKRISLRTTNY